MTKDPREHDGTGLLAEMKAGSSVALSRQRADTPHIVEEDFGNYRIKAGWLGGDFVARAFPNRESRSQGLIAEATGGSEVEAISSLKQVIEERTTQRREERRWEARSNISVPSEAEFAEALKQVRFAEAQRAMLDLHARAGEAGLTEARLQHAAGYKSNEMAQKSYGRAGGLIADYLDVTYPDPEAGNSWVEVQVLAFCDTPEDAAAVWVMHEELRKAVRASF
jgi:hypothetical protein